MTYLLGLDLGTSGVKALLLPVDDADAPVLSATVELTFSTPRPGWSEQDPTDWWRATAKVIREILDRSGVRTGEVAGLATSGQMHGTTLLDSEGEVLMPCILWNDQRSAEECRIITERVGFDQLLTWVANPALAGFTAPKLLWVQRHEPELWTRTRTVLLPKDYINYCLTGELSTEVSDASGTLLFDVAHRRWSEPMARAIDVPLSMLPPVLASTGVAGRVTAEAAAATGLMEGTPVVAGGADNACAAVGMGVVRQGEVLASIGTSGTLLAPTEEPRVDLQGRLHTFCHAVPNTWYLMGVVLSAGGSLRWFRDTIADPQCQAASVEGRDAYEVIMEEAASAPPGSEGLIFLPYLTGERTPHGDPHARGVFFGISLRHTRAHLARAVIEGVTFALADSAALMRALDVEVGTVRATGGGARSAFWMQMLADVLGARVATSGDDKGPAFGAAIIAGVGCDMFPSIAEATDRLVKPHEQFEASPKSQDTYRRGHELYGGLYPALKESFANLDGLVRDQGETNV
jgi:xylulokinase